MKASFTRSVSLPMLAAVLFLSGCSDVIESFTLEDIGGEAFPFHSPITALAESDTDGALLVGTANGVIASFSTEDGLFTQLDREGDGKTIYDIAVDKGRPFYAVAVRDGGVHIKNSWNEKSDTVRIETKDTEYSPYKILLDSNGQQLYLGTSNGFHRYPLNEQRDTAFAIMKADDKNGPRSIFSITETPSGVVFAGEGGAFVTGDGEYASKLFGKIREETRDTTVFALHDGYFLLNDGSLWKGYESPEWVRDFHSPLNFVIEKNYLYAISVSLVEVVNLNDPNEAYAIRLPEKHLNRARNKSCRQNGLVKGNCLYVAPGGSALYKLPLAPYSKREEVISLCKGSPNEIYALTAKNDLYSLLVDDKGRPGRPHYLYSFNLEDQVRLLGSAGEDELVVSIGDSIYSYSGHRVSEKPRYSTSASGEDKSITCNYWKNDALFQGRKDMVREYRTYADTFISAYPKEDSDSLECKEGVRDYCPEKIASIGYVTHDRTNVILIVGTLHSGVVYRDYMDPAALFKRMIDASAYSKILDIQAFDNMVYVLDDKRLSRFSFNDEGHPSVPAEAIELSSFGRMGGYLNHIAPIDTAKCYLYSDCYDFCSGAYYCDFMNDGDQERDSLLFEGTTINDALLFDKDKILFGGTRGVMLGDSSGAYAFIYEPNRLTRFLLASWPKNLILAIMGVLVFAVLVWLVMEQYERIKRRIRRREVVRMVEVWRRENETILTKEKMEGHLGIVEAKEKEYGSLVDIISVYKKERIFPRMDQLTLDELRTLNTSGIEQCDCAVEAVRKSRETFYSPESRKKADDIIKEILSTRDDYVLSSLLNLKSAAETSQDFEKAIEEAESRREQLNTREKKQQLATIIQNLKKDYDGKLISEMKAMSPADIEMCRKAIEQTQKAKESMQDSKKKEELDNKIKDLEKTLSGFIITKKEELAKAYKEELQGKYKGEYVLALFNTLVNESELEELTSNIDKFKEDGNKPIGQGHSNRLAVLDEIGQVIIDAEAVAIRQKDNQDLSDDDVLRSILEDIAKRYDVPFPESLKKGSVFSWMAAREEPVTECVKEHFKLYEALQDKMASRFNNLLLSILRSFSQERSALSGALTNSKGYDAFQNKVLLLLPLCRYNRVSCFLFGREGNSENNRQWENFDTVYNSTGARKNEWKKRLPKLVEKKEYGGLLNLIAKAALKMLG